MKNFNEWLIKNITLHQYDSKNEELANAGTHGLGILLSIAATVMMIVKIDSTDSQVSLTGALIFGFSMILLYSSSTFYHLSKGPVAKRLLRIMDHSTIYFLIAGTYTPIALTVGGGAGWGIFGIEWGLTILGITFTLFFWGRYGLLHVLFYIIMGWMAVFIWNPLMETVTRPFIILMISGGLSYTLGTIVYGMKKMPFHHAIWHLFVLAGSVLLFLAIYLHLM
ncbi:MAG: hemolysin III family protein [Spirochaetales bacterium]|nr:hemolysin III family protein [Spirochaetales bacterium]